MKKLALIFTLLVLVNVSLMAQATPTAKPIILQYGEPITLDMALQVMNAAKLEASNNGWTMAIAIVDTGGNLILFEKMDNTQVGSIEVAMGKAKTANNFKRPTKAFEDVLAGGGVGLRVLAIPGVFPLEGGELIMLDGKIIGAIGVSGMAATQDGVVARAAVAVVKK